jgi:hypothetical protein
MSDFNPSVRASQGLAPAFTRRAEVSVGEMSRGQIIQGDPLIKITAASAINGLAETLTVLDKLTLELISRLEPVLTSVDVANGTPPVKAGAVAPLVDDLISKANYAQFLCDRVRSALDRLAL